MPPDLRITRCTLTVRRHGGWAWRSDPTDYVQAAMDAVERALSGALTESGLPDDAIVHLREPIRLTIGRDGRPDWPDGPPLADLLRAHDDDAPSGNSRADTDASASAPSSGPRTPAAADPATTISRDGAALSTTGEVPLEVSARGLARTLEQWSRTGRLGAVLTRWPEQTVSRWLSLIYRVSHALGAGAVEVTGDAVRRIADTLGISASDDPPDSAREHIDLLLLVGAIVAATGGQLPGPMTLREASTACHTTWPPDPDPGPAVDDRDNGETGAASAYSSERAAPAAGVTRWATPPVSNAMVPALPFLVLVQLVRIGYASAMVAAAGSRAEVLRALAAGIAGKVLPPPARGWRREPVEDAAVTAASGLDPSTVAQVALGLRSEEPHLALPLRDALVSLCGDGRSSTESVEITECPEGIICGDRAAGLPLAWVAAPDELAEVLAALGGPPAHRSDAFAGFAADVAARRAFPGVELPALERTLGAVAGAALGSLAYELWSEQTGDVSPGLFIERFADLEARVETTDRLTIALPRGRRWMDLHRHGLVDAWSVPWDAGGLWELVTW